MTEQVNLTPEAEEAVILFCREHEEQLSYKSVINCVKDLKYKVSSSTRAAQLQERHQLCQGSQV